MFFLLCQITTEVFEAFASCCLHIAAPKVSSQISWVKWDAMTAKNVYDLYRGLLGLYPLTTKFDDRTVRLLDIRQVTKSTSATNPDDAPGN